MSFQDSSQLRGPLSQCLGAGPVGGSQLEFNSKHGWVLSDPMCKTTSIWMWHLPAEEQIPSTPILACPKPEALFGVFSKRQGSVPRLYPCLSGGHYQPHGSGLRVGEGVLLVFSSLAEMYSLTITMPADQRHREVLSAAGYAVTVSTFLVSWPQGELGWERVPP